MVNLRKCLFSLIFYKSLLYSPSTHCQSLITYLIDIRAECGLNTAYKLNLLHKVLLLLCTKERVSTMVIYISFVSAILNGKSI